MLRIIEQTEYLEQMLRKSAALSKEDRFAQGLQVGPDQLKTSIDLLMRNTQLRELLACAPAVRVSGSSTRRTCSECAAPAPPDLA